MTQLEIVLAAIMTLSVVLNIGLVLYSRGVVVRLLSVSEELGDLQNMINSFAGHLKAVYELDSFYGDETLRSLLEHAISFNEQLETFEYIYSLTAPQTEEGAPQDDTEESDTEEET